MTPMPGIKPEQSSITSPDFNRAELSVFIHQFHDITPPKGATQVRHLRDTIRIILPNQIHPWNISLIKKFVEVLDEQALILFMKIHNT
jgi:hypothetical protein